MTSNYTIIVENGERHEDYSWHIFKAIISGSNSIFNNFIWWSKSYRYKVIYIKARELIGNATDKYNNMLAAK